MKALKYIFILSFAVLVACNDLIDLAPQSNLNTTSYYSNVGEVNNALIGCYNGLQKTLNEEWQLTELRSDNTVMGATTSQSQVNRDLSDLDMFFPSTSHLGNYNYWQNTYYNIRNINILLNSISVNYNESKGELTYDDLKNFISLADRKKVAAEASFLRAYHYFNLVRLYGGVFLAHEPVTPEEAKDINRTTTDVIYKLIVADLLNAAANGVAVKQAVIPANDLGRANAWAAKTLLAKVYLTLNRKVEAATLLQDIITNSGYKLQTDYASIFSIANEMNSEILFAIRFKGGGLGIGSTLPNQFAPLNSGAAVANGDGRGYNYPSQELNNLYAATDTRKAANIGVLGTGTAAKLYPKKLISSPAIANDAENDWVVLRYADVLLMLSEAQGNTSASLALINQTRTRAGLTALADTSVKTIALFENVLSNERRLEFAFENHRWFDLLRANTTFTTIKIEKTMFDHQTVMYPLHYKNYPAPVLTLAQLQAFVTKERMLLPIPQREIDNNTRIVIPQNPGY